MTYLSRCTCRPVIIGATLLEEAMYLVWKYKRWGSDCVRHGGLEVHPRTNTMQRSRNEGFCWDGAGFHGDGVDAAPILNPPAAEKPRASTILMLMGGRACSWKFEIRRLIWGHAPGTHLLVT